MTVFFIQHGLRASVQSFCAQRTKVKRRNGFNVPAIAPKNARFNCTTFGYMLRNVQRFHFVGLNVAMYTASIGTLYKA